MFFWPKLSAQQVCWVRKLNAKNVERMRWLWQIKTDVHIYAYTYLYTHICNAYIYIYTLYTVYIWASGPQNLGGNRSLQRHSKVAGPSFFKGQVVKYPVRWGVTQIVRQVVSPDTVVEQEARPTGCMWYPYCGGKGDNQKVLTMNDEYKFKIWNTVTWFFQNDAAGFLFVFFPQKERVLFFLLPSGVVFFACRNHPKQKQFNESYSWIAFDHTLVV